MEQQDREPLFGQQGTVNWMRVLGHEIEAEHGAWGKISVRRVAHP